MPRFLHQESPTEKHIHAALNSVLLDKADLRSGAGAPSSWQTGSPNGTALGVYVGIEFLAW